MSGTELKMTPVRGIQPDLTTGKDYAVRSAAFPGCTDCGLILYFIGELAAYEKMSDEVIATEELLREWIFE